MLSRRAWVTLVPGAALSLCWSRAAYSLPSRELFTLGRSTNANVLRYDVRTTRDGALDVSNPLDVYWLMLAQDGRREELTWTERQLAYGFSVSGANAHGFSLRLSACPDRELHVRGDSGCFSAELQIARQPAKLKRIFVRTEGALLPSVRYVDIFGHTPEGRTVSERITPRRVSRF